MTPHIVLIIVIYYAYNGEAQLLAPAGMPFCQTILHAFAKSMTASKSAAAICSTSPICIFIYTFLDSEKNIVRLGCVYYAFRLRYD